MLVLLGLVVLFGLFTPEIFKANEDQTTPVRVAIAVGLLAPLSFRFGHAVSRRGMRCRSAGAQNPDGTRGA